jgi:MFS family permease
MKNWFLSVNGAITLSVIAFLTFLGRIFLDWRYESHLLGSPGSLEEFLNVLMFLAFAGGWVWGMLAAKSGRRGGVIACLIFALVLGVFFAALTYFVMCPPASCPKFIPNLWSWVWAELITGLLSAIALVFQLRGKKVAN